jgi:pyruvate/2-oxoglutarate dehydrogenase complex dihydrolipoamide dehydrogenase (E3) component
MALHTERLDAIVIGSGQGGKPLAQAFARAGKRTAIIERDARVGGTCVVDGCTPSKTMIASARVAHLARRAADYGVVTAQVSIDMDTVRGRKRAMVERFSSGSAQELQGQQGLELVHGEARFAGPRVIEVKSGNGKVRQMIAATVVIDTGRRAAIPPIEGLTSIGYLDNRSIMELDELPAHLVVIGGGAVGVEFAQLFRRLGSEVTMINRARRLLEKEDEDVSDAVADILADDGIRILPESEVTRARNGDGSISLDVKGPESATTIEGSHLLIAAGRVPNTDCLNLAAAGVETDSRGFIQTNDRLETSARGVYAIGDVKGGPAYTHVSYDDHRILKENLLHGGNASIAGRLVPYAVYMDPELGRVGMTEAEAREQGFDYRVAKLKMSRVARALETAETRGFMKAVVDALTREILGCAVLGVHGGEIMSVLEVAMMGTLPYTAIRDGVFAHPTFAESLNTLFADLPD